MRITGFHCVNENEKWKIKSNKWTPNLRNERLISEMRIEVLISLWALSLKNDNQGITLREWSLKNENWKISLSVGTKVIYYGYLFRVYIESMKVRQELYSFSNSMRQLIKRSVLFYLLLFDKSISFLTFLCTIFFYPEYWSRSRAHSRTFWLKLHVRSP